MSFNRFFAALICLGLSAMAPAQAATAAAAAADPDNISLNRSFAIEQIAANNLEAALVAIERVIVAAPTDLEARYLRGQILYLMGRGDEIRSEMEVLAALPLSADIKARVEKLLENIDGGGRLELTATLDVGVTDNDNANGYPTSGQYQYFDGATTSILERVDNINQDATSEVEDTVTHAMLTLRGTYGLAPGDSEYIAFSGTVRKNDGEDTPNSEADTASASLAYNLRRQAAEMNIGVNYTTIDRVNSTYSATLAKTIAVNTDVDIANVNLGLTYRLDGGNRVFYALGYTEQDHSATSTADDLDSEKLAHTIGVLLPVTRSSFLRLGYTREERDAEKSTADARAKMDRETDGYNVGLFWLPAPAHRIQAFYSVNDDDYETKLSTNPHIRADERTTIGVNYTLDAGALTPALENWKLVANYTSRETDSNLMIYNVETETVSVSARRKFDF